MPSSSTNAQQLSNPQGSGSLQFKENTFALGLSPVLIFKRKHRFDDVESVKYPPNIITSVSLRQAKPVLLKNVYSNLDFVLIYATTHCLCFWLYSSIPSSQAFKIYPLKNVDMFEPPQVLSASSSTFPLRGFTLSTVIS